MKTLFYLCCFACCSQFAIAQIKTNKLCPNKNWFIEIKAHLDNPRYRQQIKDLRQWARKNNKPKYEAMTNKLEYWVKDTSRYIERYLDSEFDAVCKRIITKDYNYLGDFMIITLFPTDFVHLYLNDLSHYNN